MKRITLLLVGVGTLAGIVVFTTTTSRNVSAQGAAPILGIKTPDGYRDWRFISVAHEAGELNDIEPFWVTIPRSRPIGKKRFHFRTAPSSRRCATGSSRQQKTTKPLAVISRSLPGLRRTFNLWSRTQKSTARPAVGASVISTTTGRRLTTRS